MSKIDEYNKQKNIYQIVKKSLYSATRRDEDGKYNHDNDKASLYLTYSGKHTNSWSDAILTLHASHDYWGSSSGYSDMDKDVATYMVKALNNNIKKIADEAIELARLDMKKLRKKAEDEAKEVLQTISN